MVSLQSVHTPVLYPHMSHLYCRQHMVALGLVDRAFTIRNMS